MTNTFIQHCETVYKALEERSLMQHSEVINADVLVFTGAVSPVFKSLGISQTYYGPIFQTLEDVGAILKVRKGARGVDTIIALRGLPEVWPEGIGWKGQVLTHAQPLTEDSRYGKILQEVQEIKQGTINGINILTALVELEQRVVALESKVSKSTTRKGA